MQNKVQYHKIFEHSTEGLIVCNSKGIIELINPSAVKMFRYNSKEDLLGKEIEVLIPIKTRSKHKEHIKGYNQDPSNRSMGKNKSLRGLCADGNELPVEISLSYYKENESLKAIAFIVDISQRVAVEDQLIENKKLELELEQSLVKEKSLNELKSRFVSMASHEFRTPLSSILSSTTLIGKYTETDQQAKRDKHILRIKKSVENLTEILNDFLSIDKLESGLVEVRKNKVDFISIIKEAIEEVEMTAKKGQRFILSSELNDLVFESDKNILKSSCENLLSNASKYSGEESEINIKVDYVNQKLLFSVADNGIGMHEDDLEGLFSRFFRGQNVTNIQGTGLGLNIVKKNLELLNGSIRCESKLNIGSTFYVELPIINY